MQKLLQFIPASYRTTALGLITIVSVLAQYGRALLDDDPATKAELSAEDFGLLAVGWGLLCARDNKVSSEQAGAKKKEG